MPSPPMIICENNCTLTPKLHTGTFNHEIGRSCTSNISLISSSPCSEKRFMQLIAIFSYGKVQLKYYSFIVKVIKYCLLQHFGKKLITIHQALNIFLFCKIQHFRAFNRVNRVGISFISRNKKLIFEFPSLPPLIWISVDSIAYSITDKAVAPQTKDASQE